MSKNQEVELMKDIQLPTNVAEVYEEFFVPALFGAWPERVIAAAHIAPGQHLLDVACGTGILARAAIPVVGGAGTVTGLDLNDGMLEVARRNAPAIAWHQGRAEALPFDDDTFDVVTSQFGLMFFEDRVRAVQEMVRVLQPGGTLAIAVWDTLDNAPGYAAVVALLVRLFGDEVADGLRAPFCLGDKQLLQRLLHEAGVPHASIQTQDGTARFPSIAAWLHTEVKGWVLADVFDDQQFTQLSTAAEQELQSFVTADGSVAFPAPAHIITAVKAA
jgi:ubiquinone/menaquinone biosynthesis C-methylase UbiE